MELESRLRALLAANAQGVSRVDVAPSHAGARGFSVAWTLWGRRTWIRLDDGRWLGTAGRKPPALGGMLRYEPF